MIILQNYSLILNDALNTRRWYFSKQKVNSSNNDYYNGTCCVGLFKTVIPNCSVEIIILCTRIRPKTVKCMWKIYYITKL